MLVIYHSRCSLPARQAAAMHMGWLGSEPPAGADGLQRAYNLLGGGAALSAGGLWALGSDGSGRRVFAFGRASRPDVVYRAFHGLADIFRLEKRSFLLQNVGPEVAWPDLKAKALAAAGLRSAALRAQGWALRAGWGEAQRAVSAALERLAVYEHGRA